MSDHPGRGKSHFSPIPGDASFDMVREIIDGTDDWLLLQEASSAAIQAYSIKAMENRIFIAVDGTTRRNHTAEISKLSLMIPEELAVPIVHNWLWIQESRAAGKLPGL